MKINLIIPAAGTSQRYGVKNKLFEKCGSSCVLLEAIKPFLAFSEITKIIVALDTTYFDEFMGWLSVLHLDDDARITAAIGSSTRTKSVRSAVSSLEEDCDAVLVHDGARPYVTGELIGRVIKKLKTSSAVVPLLPLVDNIAKVDGELVLPDVRDNYRLVQTPCAFDRKPFVSAYLAVDDDYLDDLSVVTKFSDVTASFVEGEAGNRKITTKTDLLPPLTGCGYDIHRLEPGKGLKLLGTFIECKLSLVAHSDGDVPVHALMDAILSALGEKDIGHFFPVDSALYDDCDSMALLDTVLELMNSKGYRVSNAAVSIIAEKPMLAPHIDEMRARISSALSVQPDRVGITATTNEQVGEIGAGNAIAAYASVLLTPQA